VEDLEQVRTISNRNPMYASTPSVLQRDYITVSQAASLYGVSRQSVYNLIKRKGLLTRRFGNMRLIKREHVQMFKPVLKGRSIRLEDKRGTP
jgi:excisionase family DNA binding protein